MEKLYEADPALYVMQPDGTMQVISSIDHGVFWERVAACIVMQRLQMCFDVATDEVFAAHMFRAHSATARLKIVAQLLALKIVTDRPMVEGATH